MRSEYVIDVQNIRPPIFAAHTTLGIGKTGPNRSRLQPNQPRCLEEYHKYVDWREAGNEKKKENQFMLQKKNVNTISSPEGR